MKIAMILNQLTREKYEKTRQPYRYGIQLTIMEDEFNDALEMLKNTNTIESARLMIDVLEIMLKIQNQKEFYDRKKLT